MKTKFYLLLAYMCLGFVLEGFCEWIESSYLSDLYKTIFCNFSYDDSVLFYNVFIYIRKNVRTGIEIWMFI